MQQQTKNILKKHSLRKTECRMAIIQIFLKKNFAIGQAEIESSIGDFYDRVTIYRTLKTFQEVGIIHKVLDTSGILKYALCPEVCEKEKHQHEHVHFKCNICGKISCLTELKIPTISLPKGYESLESNLLIQGICPKCN